MVFTSVEKIIHTFARWLALTGGVGLLTAITVTCLSIIGKLIRRSMNTLLGTDFNPPALSWINPILGEEELVQYAVGFALFAALPWATLQRAHIVINLLENYFSPTCNRILNLAGSIILAIFSYLLMTRQWYLIFKPARGDANSLWQQLYSGNWTELAARLQTRDESQILEIKLLPLYAIAEVCVILLFIVSLFCVWRNWRAMRTVK
ncbi:MAG: TRAP transporter small permease [Proteobacteria bacterium]|nr:TRAP transporter small permease [Pseudomonadota bacterium]